MAAKSRLEPPQKLQEQVEACLDDLHQRISTLYEHAERGMTSDEWLWLLRYRQHLMQGIDDAVTRLGQAFAKIEERNSAAVAEVEEKRPSARGVEKGKRRRKADLWDSEAVEDLLREAEEEG